MATPSAIRIRARPLVRSRMAPAETLNQTMMASNSRPTIQSAIAERARMSSASQCWRVRRTTTSPSVRRVSAYRISLLLAA